MRNAVHRYTVEGLCCAAEAGQIEAELGGRPGVASVRVDPVSGSLAVEGSVEAASVERAIAELGMRALPLDRSEADVSPPLPGWRTGLAAAAGMFWLGSVAAGPLLDSRPAAALLAIGAVVTGGRYVLPAGYRAARRGALDMNFLMSAATIGAMLIGEFAEAASVMFLFAVAQLLESRSLDRARHAIRALMELSPATAAVVRGGSEVRVPADTVRVGEVVIVRPGEKVPVDGEVLAGRSTLNQAPITGESAPVAKEPGDEVFAGTLNGEGALEVRSSRAPSDTTLARIVQAVEEAQATRAPSQAFVDRFARRYTPAVVAAAVAVAILPPLAAGGAWDEWSYRALALLVVACPCALVISTPVTVVSALAGGARRGILIKGGLHLERAARARVVAFDKTGTLTEGRPEVVSVVPLDGAEPLEVLALAAAAESRSEHPLGAAIRRRAREAGVAIPPSSETSAIAGLGVQALVDGRAVLVGNTRLFPDLAARDRRAAGAARDLESAGNTVMLVGSAAGTAEEPLRVLGAIAVADRLRPEAAYALRRLRESGVRWIAMLTGDNHPAAGRIVADLGGQIDELRSGLLPQDKLAAIRDLRATHGPVLMVGDGINDAPALAAADTGVAMGAAGTDVALETADIALMGDDLSRLPVLLSLSRKAAGIIRANIAFALLVKAVFVALAVTGLATLWMAVLADMGASLLVIANGLRATRV